MIRQTQTSVISSITIMGTTGQELLRNSVLAYVEAKSKFTAQGQATSRE